MLEIGQSSFERNNMFRNESLLKKCLGQQYFVELVSYIQEWQLCIGANAAIEALFIAFFKQKFSDIRIVAIEADQFSEIIQLLRKQQEVCWKKQPREKRGDPDDPMSRYSYEIIYTCLKLNYVPAGA